MRKRLRTLAWVLSGLMVLAVLVIWFFQDEMIYHRKSYRAEVLQRVAQQGGRRIEVMTSQGRQVAFYRPAKKRGAENSPPEFVWLVFPGRASLALDYWGQAGHWDGRFAYVFVDYPGYGSCEGHPNSDHITESIRSLAAQMCRDWGWTEEELRRHAGVIGHSLGCGAGLIAADELNLKAVILCAPFTSLTDMARGTVGWPLCCLNRNHFDNMDRLASLAEAGARTSIFHGTADHTIPCEMSQALANKFPRTVQLTLIPNCGHGRVVAEAEFLIGQTMLELSGRKKAVLTAQE